MNTSVSTRRFLRYKDLGQWVPGHCVYCRGPLPADANKARRWCSAECVHQYRMRAQSGYQREHVRQRDHGRCSMCNFDTALFAEVIGHLRVQGWQFQQDLWRQACDQACREVWPVESEFQAAQKYLDGHSRTDRPGTPAAWELYRKRSGEIAKLLGYGHRDKNTDVDLYCEVIGVSATDSLWQADHIVPVCEGGGATFHGDPMANLRTLCSGCHKLETKALAGRRAKKKKLPP